MKPEAGKFYRGNANEYGDTIWHAVFDSPLGLQSRSIETSWHTRFSCKGETLKSADNIDEEEFQEEITKEEFEKVLDDTAQAVLDLKQSIF
jgi:hypothetical protein